MVNLRNTENADTTELAAISMNLFSAPCYCEACEPIAREPRIDAFYAICLVQLQSLCRHTYERLTNFYP